MKIYSQNSVEQDTGKPMKDMTPEEIYAYCYSLPNGSGMTTVKACIITRYRTESRNFHGVIWQTNSDGTRTPIHGKLATREEERIMYRGKE